MPPKDRLSPNDLRILSLLQRDGRASYAELGAAAGMSAPSAHERVKRLESRGIVHGYRAVVDAAASGSACSRSAASARHRGRPRPT